MRFLSLEEVIIIHDDQIERYGGSHGIRDLFLLESAIARLQTTFGGTDLYPSIFLKAAVLAHSLIKNHAFVDGNKRTGTVSMLVFLEINEYKLNISQKKLVEIILKVESGKWSLERFKKTIDINSSKIV